MFLCFNFVIDFIIVAVIFNCQNTVSFFDAGVQPDT